MNGMAPKTPRPDSWLHDDRFTEFLAAYRYATGRAPRAAPAFSKVTPEEAYWIWKTINTGVEHHRARQA